MPSTPFEEKGRCGKTVKGSIWSRGGTIRCTRQGLTHYPKPDSVKELVDYFCIGCPEASA